MRRPLKPFVTEYKNPSRRSKDAFEMQAGDDQPDIGSDATPRPFMPADDSSYEAAMRAADALFSDTPKAHPVVYATASEAFRPAEPPPALAPERGGRILQAIEETPADPFAALEAERAPKRRGRKPGSKNKPKFVPEPSAIRVPASVPVAAFAAPTPVAAPRPTPAVEARPRVVALAAPGQAPKARVPFSWVRTRLRPGEKWKLRIPKVAW